MLNKQRKLKALIPIFFIASTIMVSCNKDTGYYAAKVEDKSFKGDTYQYLKSKPGVFDSLIKVIDRLGYQDILKNDSITLFAPPNQCFELVLNNLNNLRRQSELEPLSLSNVNALHLDTMMSQYIIKGVHSTQSLDLQDGVSLFGVKYNYPMNARLGKSSSSGYIEGGAQNVLFQNTNRSALVNYWTSTTTTSNNIKTNNGIVHVLSSDHVFGFTQFVRRFTYKPPPPSLILSVGGKISVSSCTYSKCDSLYFEGYGRLVDRDRQTKFLEAPFRNGWLKFEFNEPTVVGAYTLVSAGDAEDRDPGNWILEGSNNNSNWSTLDIRTDETFRERYMERVFYFSNKIAYKYYRLTINSMRSGGDAFQLAEWDLNEPDK